MSQHLFHNTNLPPRPQSAWLLTCLSESAFCSFSRLGIQGLFGLLCWLWMVPVSSASEALSLATYNLQNYRLAPHEGFSAKSLKSCLAAQELAIECNADVLLIQEIGSEKALKHFQAGLSQKGLHYPHHILARLPDASIHLGLLSRLPPLRSQHHTNAFALYGKAFRPSRGFLEVDFQVSKNRQIKIWGIHLKSKRPDLRADSWDLRTREAGLLRSLVNQTLKEQPDQWMAVLGDFNDDPRSHTLEILRGKGRAAFLDTRPLEGGPDRPHKWSMRQGQKQVAWTHFFQKEDTQSRLDYVLVSRSLFRFYQYPKSYVLDASNWAQASDHRPVVTHFLLP